MARYKCTKRQTDNNCAVSIPNQDRCELMRNFQTPINYDIPQQVSPYTIPVPRLGR